VRFWDSSAIVALFVTQRGSEACTTLARTDPAMAVWWGTIIECEAALNRLVRTGVLTNAAVPSLRVALAHLPWREIAPTQEIRDIAALVLRRHPLKAGDALQLAAGLSWCAGSALEKPFVTLDRDLAKAASDEGFAVIPQL
jgi:predicted nucleic acid-binding protein